VPGVRHSAVELDVHTGRHPLPSSVVDAGMITDSEKLHVFSTMTQPLSVELLPVHA
jgi:hypothetical protein